MRTIQTSDLSKRDLKKEIRSLKELLELRNQDYLFFGKTSEDDLEDQRIKNNLQKLEDALFIIEDSE